MKCRVVDLKTTNYRGREVDSLDLGWFVGLLEHVGAGWGQEEILSELSSG